jgi:predicted metal-dependent hydrolase
MANSQIIQFEGIGPVTFMHNPRAKRIIITIRPHRGVRVAIPQRSSIDSAMDFVHRKEKWIKKHLTTIEESKKQKNVINEAFLAIDKKEARKSIKKRLRELARQNGFIYGKVSIRNQRTRWGSCSGKNCISLNMKLVVLPQDLFDYVIFHELVHTRIHNHSDRFWEELNKYVGDGKAKAKTLTEYGLGIL